MSKVEIKPKPDFIPALTLVGLPEYISSDDENNEPEDDVYIAATKGLKNKNRSF